MEKKSTKEKNVGGSVLPETIDRRRNRLVEKERTSEKEGTSREGRNVEQRRRNRRERKEHRGDEMAMALRQQRRREATGWSTGVGKMQEASRESHETAFFFGSLTGEDRVRRRV